VAVHACNRSSEESRGRRSEAVLGKSTRPYLKNKVKSKRLGGVAQVIECLLSRHEALNSNLVL
jgi:hypothetical protein